MGKSYVITSRTVRIFTNRVESWFRLSQEQRDEVISQSLAVFSQKVNRGERIEEPLRWLMKTAKLLRRAIIRQEQKRVKCESRDLTELEDSISIQSFPSEDEIRISDAVDKALSRLSENEQSMIRMHDVKEITISNAARALGVSRSTAKSWYSRARRKLQRDPTLIAILGDLK